MAIPIVAEAPPIRDVDGVLRVAKTSVTLQTVLWTFQQGSTPEDIVDQFPVLTLGDVYDVIAYYLRHQDEIDRYLDVQDQRYHKAANDLRAQIPETSLHAKLRARRQR